MTPEDKDGSELNSVRATERIGRAAAPLNKHQIVKMYNCINYIILYIYSVYYYK